MTKPTVAVVNLIVKLTLWLVFVVVAVVCSCPFHFHLVAEASSGAGSGSSPFFSNNRRGRWGPPFYQQHDNNSNNNKIPKTASSSFQADIDRHSKLMASLQTKSSFLSNDNDNDNNHVIFPRGGQVDHVAATAAAIPKNIVNFVATLTQILIQFGNVVLPPVVAVVSLVIDFYRALPKDAIVAQVGLVYCFAGGYYPTLFSSISAAQQFGWHVMVAALQDLTLEALAVIRALEEHDAKSSSSSSFFTSDPKSRALLFRQKTGVVLATVDPMKINQAAGALYTTWMGVCSVLEKEYARVITLSLTMAEYLENMAQFIFGPPARLCINQDYHAWIPVVIGWGCKAAAMNIAWRIQRVMTAATSALTGGLLFARALARMLSKRGIRLFGAIRQDNDDENATLFDEVVGFLVAGLGFYTQFEAQWRSGFSFRVPFPFYLVTWPFDWAEKWIQWQITKK